MKRAYKIFGYSLLLLSLVGCQKSETDKANDKGEQPLELPERVSKNVVQYPPEFAKKWFSGKAELTSYELEINRYGEKREGEAVFIFVTEPFLRVDQVKADITTSRATQAMKLNISKKFLTGIYPYSLMESHFTTLDEPSYSLKTTFSAQEWCGHVYVQINNRDSLEVMSRSYFQKEGDQDMRVKKGMLEDDLWTLIRLAPEKLVEGDLWMIPSLEYCRLRHHEIKYYKAQAIIITNEECNTYQVDYPELQRTVRLFYDLEFPYEILGWEEFNGGVMSSKGVRKKSKMLDYWNKNGKEDLHYRDSLGLNLR